MTAAFVESVRLLLELHELFVAGRQQGPEADAVRDAMERPWYDMTDDERPRVEQLSADLYTLGEREPGAPPDAPLRERFEAVCAAEEWDAVLALLLEHPGLEVPASRARLRAHAWEALGVPEAAAAFEEDARRCLRVLPPARRDAARGAAWRLAGVREDRRREAA